MMKDYKLKLRNLLVSHTLGWVIGTPFRFRLIRKTVVLARIDETCDFSIEEKATRRKWKKGPIFDYTD
jgi:hypothetical protein